MTTLELKQYIDKVLGNNLRCLLPSYWWKRLFSLTLDKVDEKLDAANIKTINGESVIGEGNLKVGITSVSSMEELNALEAEVGDIATVGYESLNLVSAANLKEAYSGTFLDEWDSLTRIGKVEIGEPYIEEGRIASITLHSKAQYGIKAIIITCDNGEFMFTHLYYGSFLEKSLDEINEILQNEDYRYLNGSYPDVLDKTYKLYAHSSSANAYIKGDTWTRLLKEGDAAGIELRDLYIYENYDGTFTNLTEEQKAWNLETLELVKQGKAIVRTTLHGVTFILELFNEDNEYQFGYTQFSPSGGVAISVYVAEDGLSGIKVKESHFDSELSEASTNAVQNKVVTAALNEKASIAYVDEKVANAGSNITVDSELSDTSENPLQNKVIYECLYGMSEEYIRMYEELGAGMLEMSKNLYTELQKKVDQSYVNDAIANAITTTLNTAV